MADGFVMFTKHFKYLGSYIVYNLRDDFNIQSCITAANQSMGTHPQEILGQPTRQCLQQIHHFQSHPSKLIAMGLWNLVTPRITS